MGRGGTAALSIKYSAPAALKSDSEKFAALVVNLELQWTSVLTQSASKKQTKVTKYTQNTRPQCFLHPCKKKSSMYCSTGHHLLVKQQFFWNLWIKNEGFINAGAV